MKKLFSLILFLFSITLTPTVVSAGVITDISNDNIIPFFQSEFPADEDDRADLYDKFDRVEELCVWYVFWWSWKTELTIDDIAKFDESWNVIFEMKSYIIRNLARCYASYIDLYVATPESKAPTLNQIVKNISILDSIKYSSKSLVNWTNRLWYWAYKLVKWWIISWSWNDYSWILSKYDSDTDLSKASNRWPAMLASHLEFHILDKKKELYNSKNKKFPIENIIKYLELLNWVTCASKYEVWKTNLMYIFQEWFWEEYSSYCIFDKTLYEWYKTNKLWLMERDPYWLFWIFPFWEYFVDTAVYLSNWLIYISSDYFSLVFKSPEIDTKALRENYKNPDNILWIMNLLNVLIITFLSLFFINKKMHSRTDKTWTSFILTYVLYLWISYWFYNWIYPLLSKILNWFPAIIYDSVIWFVSTASYSFIDLEVFKNALSFEIYDMPLVSSFWIFTLIWILINLILIAIFAIIWFLKVLFIYLITTLFIIIGWLTLIWKVDKDDWVDILKDKSPSSIMKLWWIVISVRALSFLFTTFFISLSFQLFNWFLFLISYFTFWSVSLDYNILSKIPEWGFISFVYLVATLIVIVRFLWFVVFFPYIYYYLLTLFIKFWLERPDAVITKHTWSLLKWWKITIKSWDDDITTSTKVINDVKIAHEKKKEENPTYRAISNRISLSKEWIQEFFSNNKKIWIDNSDEISLPNKVIRNWFSWITKVILWWVTEDKVEELKSSQEYLQKERERTKLENPDSMLISSLDKHIWKNVDELSKIKGGEYENNNKSIIWLISRKVEIESIWDIKNPEYEDINREIKKLEKNNKELSEDYNIELKTPEVLFDEYTNKISKSITKLTSLKYDDGYENSDEYKESKLELIDLYKNRKLITKQYDLQKHIKESFEKEIWNVKVNMDVSDIDNKIIKLENTYTAYEKQFNNSIISEDVFENKSIEIANNIEALEKEREQTLSNTSKLDF